ncbi:MAG: hypothetical protein GXO22_02620 [Aquificae bacterium]|nr:hypothetical protein [Aquificota bacterium]
MKRNLTVLLLILSVFSLGYAVPQKLEDIILREKEFQIDFIFSYNNSSFTNLVDNEVISQDTIYYLTNIRYDLTSRFEIFLFGSFVSNFIKIFNEEDLKVETGSFHNLGPIGTGFSLQLLKENSYPGITLSVVTNIHDRLILGGEEKRAWFDSFSFYLSTHYTIDPVVLLITTMYRYNRDITIDGKTLNYGDTFFISPQFYFLANPYLSINVGLRYIHQGKDKLDGKVIMIERNLVGFLMGLNYEIKEGLFVAVDGEFRYRSDYSQNILNVRLTFRF